MEKDKKKKKNHGHARGVGEFLIDGRGPDTVMDVVPASSGMVDG